MKKQILAFILTLAVGTTGILAMAPILASHADELTDKGEQDTAAAVSTTNLKDSAVEKKDSAYIDKLIESMSTEDKVAQMVMVKFDKYNGTNVETLPNEIAAALAKHPYNGIIIKAENAQDNEKLVRLTDQMQSANAKAELTGQDGTTYSSPQLFLSVDQEGGRVTRIAHGTQFAGNMGLAATNDAKNAYTTGTIIGDEIDVLGMNVDFAPVVDVNNNPQNPVIGVRSFSDDPTIVTNFGKQFQKGLHDAGVIACLKHFPGHGNTQTDTHTGMTVLDSTYSQLKKTELIPFQGCMKDGTKMIMTAHISYPNIENTTYKSKSSGEDIYLPATLSETFITDILRKDLGYNGLVVTDALEMGAIADHFDPYDTAKLAIAAGDDILLQPVATNNAAGLKNLENYIKTVASLVDASASNTEKVNAAVKRILTVKNAEGMLAAYDSGDIESSVTKAKETVGSEAHHNTEWDLMKQGITMVKNEDNTLPIDSDKKTIILCPKADAENSVAYALSKLLSDGKLKSTGSIEGLYDYSNKTYDEMAQAINGYDNVILFTATSSTGALNPATEAGAQSKILTDLIDQAHKNGSKVTLVSTLIPYDVARYTAADAILITFSNRGANEDPRASEGSSVMQYGPGIPVAVYMAFATPEKSYTGRLPINIPKLDASYSPSSSILYARGFGYGLRSNSLSVTTSYTRKQGNKQTIKLNAKATGGTITYKSNTTGVTVSNSGVVTIAKNFTGAATITVTAGSRLYNTVTKTVTVKVTPAAPVISKKTVKGKKATTSWKSVPNASGYQISYSTSSKFPANATTTKRIIKTSLTFNKKSSGSKYYIKVRSYKTCKVNGKTVKLYSSWSKVNKL